MEKEADAEFLLRIHLIDGIFRLEPVERAFSPTIGNPVELTILEFAERNPDGISNAPKIIYSRAGG